MARIEIDPNYSSPTFSRATAATDIFKKEDVQSLAAALSTHVHDGTGKGLPVAASGIPTGSITSAMIADGTIATADLAAHAISQVAYAAGSTSGPTTTSGGPTDIPDLAVTLTTTGGDVLVWVVCDFLFSIATIIGGLNVRMDAGADTPGITIPQPTTAATQIVSASTFAYYAAPSAGAHTWRGRWSLNAGQLTAYSTLRYIMALELKK